MKTLIFDGHNAAWRLFNAIRDPLTVDGKPIQVVFGFLRLLRKSLEKFEPDRALVSWDSQGDLIRSALFPEYKAHRREKRKSDPDSRRSAKEVNSQIDMLKELLPYLCVYQVSIPHIEGDDIVAMSCEVLVGKKIVVSNDQDMLQLVSEKVKVYFPVRDRIYTLENFRELIGVPVELYPNVRAIVGDGSDGLPGVAKGVGESTAIYLVNKYNSLEKIYSSKIADKVCKKGKRFKLVYSVGARDRAFRNLQIMDLKACQFEMAKDHIRYALYKSQRFDRAKVQRYFMEKKFASLLKDFARWTQPFERLG